jgi:excinuclease ABC subunit A
VSSGAVIRVRGARTHNLAGVDVDIPTGRFVVITGPSGAGKSSLAFDTIFAEAQRRYLEALSTELRAQASRLPRPDVDAIDGLMPAIALDQRTLPRSPRSTLGTVTEIADHLRLLYARVGVPHCPICGEVVRAETPQEIVDTILQKPEKTRVIVRAPVGRGLTDLEPLFDRLRKDGWVRAVVDGATIDLGAVPKLAKKPHDVDVVVDRFVVKDGIRSRASDSVELALRAGDGRMRLELGGDASTPGELTFHSQRFACEKDDYVFPEIEPALFSFNAQAGACPTCQGLGAIRAATEESAIPDRSRTLRDGAVVAWGAPRSVAYAVEVKRAVDALGVDPDVPFGKLPAAQRAALMAGGAGKKKKPYEGIARFVEERIAAEDDETDEGALDLDALEALREDVVCDACGGSRLRPEARAVELGGKSISDLGAMPLEEARKHLGAIFPAIPERMRGVAKPILEGALVRLDALVEVGLGLLPLDRTTRALSAGETERARLAGIAAGGLRSVLYILDEPSRGLHPSDTERLIAMLRRLRDGGASVVVVDHDLELIRAADHVIDVGPAAGVAGGRIVSQGTPSELAGVTGPWLRGERTLPKVARRSPSGLLKIRGARDLDIPLGVLTAIAGKSGVGKSAFVHGALVPAVRASLDGRGRGGRGYKRLGWDERGGVDSRGLGRR